jgi:hypothetical protein
LNTWKFVALFVISGLKLIVGIVENVPTAMKNIGGRKDTIRII